MRRGVKYALFWLPPLAALAWGGYGFISSGDSYRFAAWKNFRDHAGEDAVRSLAKDWRKNLDRFDFAWSPSSGFLRFTDAARTNEWVSRVSAALKRRPVRNRVEGGYSIPARREIVRWRRVGERDAPTYVGKVYAYDGYTEIRYILENRLFCQTQIFFFLFAFSTVMTCFIYSKNVKDDFLAAAAHDLTTPLVAMRGMIGRDDDEVRRLNERMMRLVDNIKDFLRLGTRRPPRRERFDLLAAYREAYRVFAADYRDLLKGVDVPVETSGDECMVEGDELMTVQILWNLLGNDLKYAAPYGKVGVCVVSAIGRDGSPRVRLELADEGQGMTPWQMRRAFSRYYRARTVLESGKGGFGIGLCTAREFARAMGGNLTVRANEPKGCVFTLELPAAKGRGALA